MRYTPAGLIATITDAQNNVTHYEYDARGNRTAVVDAANNRTTFTYDSRNRLTVITNPDSTTTHFAYDTRGRRTSVTDANNNTTTYAYDDADRLTSVTDALSQVTAYAYDSENNLTSITDALSRATTFNYDSMGRVTSTVFPPASGSGTGLSETYNYDQIGNLLSKVDRNSNTTTYTYDALNRLTRKTYQDSTHVDFTYDVASRLTQAADATGTYGMSYDNMGRLTGTNTQYSFIPSHTFTMSYTYDLASNRTGMTDPQSGGTSYTYDTLNRLTTLTNPQSQAFTFGYDNLSRRTSLARPNSVNTAYAYDTLSRLTSITHGPTSSPIDGVSYTLDNVGNRTSRTSLAPPPPSFPFAPIPPSPNRQYLYDKTYQLTNEITPCTYECLQYMCSEFDPICPPPAENDSYLYDAVGNATTFFSNSGNSYNGSNELTVDYSSNYYGYDNNGNRTTISQPCSGTGCSGNVVVASYTWDFENRLTQVSNGDTITFKYDPFGRRIQKSSSAGTVNYIYDGANIIEQLDSSGAMVAKYTQGAGVDEPLAILQGGVSSYFHADGLGSITSVTDADGNPFNATSYTAFGNAVPTSFTVVGPVDFASSYGFTGREYDSETGLYYYRARYYDPNVGRFLSEDPIGLNGGINEYAYAHNDPIGRIDPAGTDDHPGISSLLDAIQWARGRYHPVAHVEDATTAALSATPAASNLIGKFKKNRCKDGIYCGDFNYRQYFTTFNMVGQTVGGFCAKVTEIGRGRILVDAWNAWGLESGTRFPQLGSENNRTHPSIQDMLNGAPIRYPKSILNNTDSGLGATTTTRYIWIQKSPCCE